MTTTTNPAGHDPAAADTLTGPDLVRLAAVQQLITDPDRTTRRLELLGEPTPVPELFIVPRRDPAGGYCGSFSLTHAPSGRAAADDYDPTWFGGGRATIEELRELAAELAGLGVDWVWTDPAGAPPEVMTAAGAVVMAWRRRAGRTHEPDEPEPDDEPDESENDWCVCEDGSCGDHGWEGESS